MQHQLVIENLLVVINTYKSVIYVQMFQLVFLSRFLIKDMICYMYNTI